jgi:hypothetical protein
LGVGGDTSYTSISDFQSVAVDNKGAGDEEFGNGLVQCYSQDDSYRLASYVDFLYFWRYDDDTF